MRPIFPLMKLEAHERMTFGDVESKVYLNFIDRALSLNENASFLYFSLPKHLQCCLDALSHSPDWRIGWCSRGGPAILFTHFRPVTEDHEERREIYSAIVSAFGSRENDRAPSFPLRATVSGGGCVTR